MCLFKNKWDRAEKIFFTQRVKVTTKNHHLQLIIIIANYFKPNSKKLSTSTINNDLVHRVNKTLELIHPKCKELLKMYYSDQQNINLITKKLGYTSAKEVKLRKYKCLELIKRELKYN